MAHASARQDEIGSEIGAQASVPIAPTKSRSLRRLQLRTLMASGDLLSIVLGVSVGEFLRNGRWFDAQVCGVLAILTPIFVSLALNGGAFDFDAIERWQKGVRRALPALITAAFVLLGVGFALKISADYSRVAVMLGALLAIVLMTAFRWASGKAVAAVLPHGLIDEVVLYDGVRPWPHLAGRTINAQALGLRPALDCPHMFDRMGQALYKCDRVLIACSPERRQAWTAALKGLGVEVQVLIPELEQLGVLGTGNSNGRLTAVVARGPLRKTDAMLKRAFDIAVSLFFLPALLGVTVLVAIAIKLDDGGPLFFRQTRIGQGNRLFSVLKFRSMRVGSLDAQGRTSTQRGDARVTRIGNILRKTSVDELPQLFNVLKGDMSIVGPRPHALGSTAADSLFWDVDKRYWLRHAVKPGLTGLAQVRGFRGATATADDLTNRVQADLEYLVGWSLWRDLRILAATLKVVLHPNAF
jgi:exopolysaccharide biosynthesis polyprenyl glycosylphosphotransferase